MIDNNHDLDYMHTLDQLANQYYTCHYCGTLVDIDDLPLEAAGHRVFCSSNCHVEYSGDQDTFGYIEDKYDE